MTDTLAGVTQVMFPSLFSAYPHLKSGKIVALGVAGARRAKVQPDTAHGWPSWGSKAWTWRSGTRCSPRPTPMPTWWPS